MTTDSSAVTDLEQAGKLVAAKREDAGPGLVEARRAAEDEARDLLDRTAWNLLVVPPWCQPKQLALGGGYRHLWVWRQSPWR